MKDRVILTASEGKLLTNGQYVGRVVQLSLQEDPANWHEITKEEAEEKLGLLI